MQDETPREQEAILLDRRGGVSSAQGAVWWRGQCIDAEPQMRWRSRDRMEAPEQSRKRSSG